MSSGSEGSNGPANPPWQFSGDSLLQAAFLAGDNPVFLVDLQSWRILACNSASERVFGHRQKDLTGAEIRILYKSDAEHQDFGARAETALLQGAGSYHGHFHMCRRDGSIFPTEHLVQLIRDDDGAPCAAIHIVRDLIEVAGQEAADATGDLGGNGFRVLATNLPGLAFKYVQMVDGTDRFTFLAGSLFRDYAIDPKAVYADTEAFFGTLFQMDRAQLEDEFVRCQSSLSVVDCEIRMRTPDGEPAWLRVLSQPRSLDDGSTIWDGFALDVTRERTAETWFHYLATHDALTGLPNRAQFLESLQDTIQTVQRTQGRLVVAAIDVKNMAAINTSHGLSVGDELLRCVGERLTQFLGGEALVARGYGDTFLALVSVTDDDPELTGTLQRFQSTFEHAFSLQNDIEIMTTGRMGFALYPDDGGDADALLNAATIALRSARRQQAVPYQFYGEEFGQQLRERMSRQGALASAIDAGELVPYFQPQVSLADGSLIGLEALVRWCRPDGSTVLPGEFIPLAEESGLILPLGNAIMKAVITQICVWGDAGFSVPPLSVNCSARQFHSADFELMWRQSILEADIDPALVVIELTESTLLDDYAAAERTMRSMTEFGVGFSIDDFGTGFSSLSYLAYLPFHILQIDRSFVSALGTSERQSAITELLVSMGHALGVTVIAEGVEQEGQVQNLRRLRCHGAQGYWYAKPLSPSEVTAWLQPSAGSNE